MSTLPLFTIFLSLLSFFLPTQLGYHFNSSSSNIIGFKIDYLLPTLYLTDILTVVVITLGLKKIKATNKFIIFLIFYFGFAILNILSSEIFIAALYKWLRITEMLFLGLVVKNNNVNAFKHVILPLSYSVFIASFLGIIQFISKGSIGGIFYFLGERNFLFSDPNIAPYPYSVFSHPNSFAGFLLVFSLLTFKYRKQFRKSSFLALLILVITCLILTNSLNVFVTIGIITFLFLGNDKLFAFVGLDLGARFITHRIELIRASLLMVGKNWLTGVGLNNFIPNLVKVSNTYINSWELQPVHNIFLLVLAETGILGTTMFFILIFNFLTISNYPLLAILISGLNDHYWLTLQQNMLLFTFVLALTKKSQK